MDKKKLYQKLLLFYRPFLGKFAVAWGFVALITTFDMVMPYSIGRIIDATNAKDFSAAYFWAGLAIGTMFLSRSIIQCIEYIYEVKNIDYTVETAFRRIGLLKMGELSIGQHQNQNSGIKQDLVINGCNSLIQMNEQIVYNISFMVLSALIGLSVLFVSNKAIATITAASIGLYLLISVIFNQKYGGELDAVIKKDNSSQKRCTDYIRNIALLLINSNQVAGLKNYERVRHEYEESGKKYWIRYVKFFNFGNAIIIANTSFVLLYSIHLYRTGQISLGQISIYIFWSNLTTGFLRNFNNVFRNVLRQLARIKKFFHFLDIRSETETPTDEIELKDFKGRIEFRDLSFEYPEWNYFKDFEDEENDENEKELASKKETEKRGPVLKKLNFTIQAKEKVAFVGHSGAGKSTIISLIFRAYKPQSGQILLDGIDMDRLDPQKFRRQIGLVEQDIQLMDDTIRANLLIGLNGEGQEVSDEELWQALKTAKLEKLSQRLKKGLDTNIGERGVKLSGGEKQRLAIARALLKKAPVIIFDEATSSLDSLNEGEIHEAMAEASRGMTVITIAHRLATVKNADRIFVMEEGCIIAEGKHEELIENCPTYRQLVEKQIVAF
jgi:ABC-type multidrug transport system fused ATPase/permease subunit